MTKEFDRRRVMAKRPEQQSVLSSVLHLALVPIRTATSKAAQRAYLGTALLTVASIFLFVLSTVAYVFFYYSYVPQIGVTRPIHLQFGNGHPHGIAQLSSTLISQQAYDISIALHLPRTPTNLASGNFMVDLTLLAPTQPGASSIERFQSTFDASRNGSATALGHSRRSAILPYASPIVSTAHTLVNLPWMVFGWKRESNKLEVPMFEKVEFPRGWKNIPDQVKVVLESDEKMQVYKADVRVRARFWGLRWIMYNHRIISFMFFTSTFFTLSISSTVLAYALFSMYLASPRSTLEKESSGVKEEDSDNERELVKPLSTSDLSDTARAFPTLGRQRPLEFQGRPAEIPIKDEEIENYGGIELLAEADDEDDFEDEASSAWRDSGIGTGREDRGRRPLRRRKSSQEP